jgi:hypothetical protein
MKFILPVILIITLCSCNKKQSGQIISTSSLLDELTDLQRLTRLPGENYREVQFSSYDRRSKQPDDSCWFSNEDGFGNEPLPAFQEVLKSPDSTGVGEYLICDVRQPGAIVRLWTAGINGRIRLYLDNIDEPVFEGEAQDFFWKTAERLSGSDTSPEFSDFLRQYDATYFPVPFASRCRLEWIGDIRRIHFYHVGIRLYDKRTKVVTFRPEDFEDYAVKLEKVKRIYSDPSLLDSTVVAPREIPLTDVADSSSVDLFSSNEGGAIVYFALKLLSDDPEGALRESILTIRFDDATVPQVQAPTGDFFGTGPGLNPYISLPLTVQPDGQMICRFVMPFSRNVHIGIENFSGKKIRVKGEVRIADFPWDEGATMYFRAHWRIDHGLTASTFIAGKNTIQDINYIMASGTGRVVGAAAMVYNPSRATTSWGNWWGEGDEKIFVDNDTFPSFFGTGSEDYFNYSWSSTRIFSYPYCGQTRNDGPGNRGYVSDYRWHIADDILFHDKIAFRMELWHHGVVPDFSYGRIVYYYALPGAIDDVRQISSTDIRRLPYQKWDPIAYLGSAGFSYYQAEKLIPVSASVKAEKGKLWADSLIVMWKPVRRGEKIKFRIPVDREIENSMLGLTLSHNPDGGNIIVSLNGQYLRFDGNEFINLYEPAQTSLVNHFSDTVTLKKGFNEIVLESIESSNRKKVGIDFIWLKMK